jgi:hypothetical protein
MTEGMKWVPDNDILGSSVRFEEKNLAICGEIIYNC